MDFDKINKIYESNVLKKTHTHYDYNPRLWHSLNKLYKVNSKYKYLNKKQVVLLNRYVHQEIILNKKLFSKTFKKN
mgnify:CR=1 FL=1